jgi:predicted alpha/beta hydrolase
MNPIKPAASPSGPVTTRTAPTGARRSQPAPSTWLTAPDGRALAATWTEPQGPTRAVTVISSATGVPRGYYRAFADWLSERGHAVLTYDYRGMGDSRQGPLRQERASMRDWAVHDMSAALAAAEARRAGTGLPLMLVGHSFGGNSIAFAQGVERADALLMVAAQIPTLQHFPGWRRQATAVFFRAWVPTVSRLMGHLPAWANGGGEPLPRDVALQWCDWGVRESWAFSDPAMAPHRAAAAVVAPVHLWNVADDLTYAPPGAVDALAAEFRNAVVQRHTVHAAELGLPFLGHFGAFRRSAGPALWSRWMAPLEQAVPALGAG